MLCPSEPAAENGISVCVAAPSAAPAPVVVQDFNSGPDGGVKPENTGPNGTVASGNGSGCCTPVVPTTTAANSASVDADGGGDPKLKGLCVTQRGAELTADSYSSTDSGGTAVVAPRYCNDPYCQLKEDATSVVVAVVPTQADGVVRSWKCEVCCKQFAQKHHLQTHLLCHSGVKRFECQVCHKAFKQQAHLNTHLLIHEGRRPHRCPHCDHSFLQVRRPSVSAAVSVNGNYDHRVGAVDSCLISVMPVPKVWCTTPLEQLPRWNVFRLLC